MARQVRQPVRVEVNAADMPIRFTWRGLVYQVEVIGHWRLQDRWWDAQRFSNRHYYRVMTHDHQVFELYCDLAPVAAGGWMLDKVQD